MKTAIALLISACSLVACGGSGGSSTPVPLPTTLSKILPTQGDNLTYLLTTTATGGPAINSSYTTVYTTVNGNGTLASTTTFGTGSSIQTVNIAADFGTTDYTQGATQCINSADDISFNSYPAIFGQAFNNSFTQTCTTFGSPSTSKTITKTGSLQSFEYVAVPAGTFYAAKSVYTETQSIPGTSTFVLNYTCWWDTGTGRRVKCQDTYTLTPAVGSVSTGSHLAVLTGYSAAGHATVLTVSRFSGNWSVSYIGGDVGSCTIPETDTGVITGSCFPNAGGSFTVTGTVNVNGAVVVTAAGGAVFTGQLSSPLAGSGTWAGNGLSGTWTSMHQ